MEEGFSLADLQAQLPPVPCLHVLADVQQVKAEAVKARANLSMTQTEKQTHTYRKIKHSTTHTYRYISIVTNTQGPTVTYRHNYSNTITQAHIEF